MVCGWHQNVSDKGLAPFSSESWQKSWNKKILHYSRQGNPHTLNKCAKSKLYLWHKSCCLPGVAVNSAHLMKSLPLLSVRPTSGTLVLDTLVIICGVFIFFSMSHLPQFVPLSTHQLRDLVKVLCQLPKDSLVSQLKNVCTLLLGHSIILLVASFIYFCKTNKDTVAVAEL